MVDPLGVTTDDLGGPYDAILALYVLINVRQRQTDLALTKIAAALRPGGSFYVSIQDSNGELPGDYRMVCWPHDEFSVRLVRAGFSIERHERHVDCDDHAWSSYIARKL
ncbi:class I SAM-dependent methyltransferase [Streptomyces sp. SID13031]|uniref:class I SAM-dependent methyltransferase n=1 Tax=Streptomyces sp. SID13031 TaxID=2706046 RepID=UPI0013CDDB4F|nr:class I SAM-dependent methyltransferase [Streptomyces sp. SID13031]NEA31229.1 class I SAM-dependent methyltransferase [Streptomyces sp. SID13031]